MKTVHFLLLMVLSAGVSFGANEKTIIEEGFFLNGVEGELTKEPNVDVWTFRPDEAIVAKEDQTLPAGSAIRMLPCSVLEQMTSLAGEDNKLQVRLWALFTEYNEFNYLYSVYFLPLSTDGSAAQKPDEKKDENAENNEESKTEKSDSIIPTDILNQIGSNKTPDLNMFQQMAVVTGDRNMIGRAGYLKQKDKVRLFQLDAFGRNVNKNQYILLPSSMLQSTEELLDKTPGRQRYNVSGLVTRYKDRNYILLRRASRTYTNGNFTQ